MNIDWFIVKENIIRAISYDPEAPMLFNSGFFLLFFTIFIGIYALIYQNRWVRVFYVVAFSFFFYYKSSGIYLLNLVLLIIVDYLIAHWLYKIKNPDGRQFVLWIAILFNLSFLIYFKYTNFFLENIIYISGGEFKKLDIFLPIGISFYTFQTISYLVDVSKREILPSKNIFDFAFYLSFFPQLVAGPIVRAVDFLPQIHKKIVFTKEEMGAGLFMVLKGLFKKAVIADYVGQYVTIVYSNPSGYSGFENLMAMYAYTLQIYCDFSGYSDMAIGLALIMGFQLPENFRSPYNSLSITEFWRRWHISLSFWLRDYIYIPLGGNRKGKFNQYLFLMATMLIGGLWHGSSWNFVIWGGMHGLGLVFHKLFSENIKRGTLAKFFPTPVSWFLTFHFVAFLWIFFRIPDFQTAWLSIFTIFTNFDFAYLAPFWDTRPLLVVLLIIGYLIHFIPERRKTQLSEKFIMMPFLVKTVIAIIIIQMVIQIQSENVQPFIYFQF